MMKKNFFGTLLLFVSASVLANTAKIGETEYETLAEAVAAVPIDVENVTTVQLLENAQGDGIIVPSGTKMVLDLGGYTYEVTGNLAGSTGTKTQAFQLLKNSDITIQNGTITSSVALMLIQNYANLTLLNVTLDGTKLSGTGRYVLSNNNGNILIGAGTVINAKEGDIAFDVYNWVSAGYNAVTVTVEDATINGPIELAQSNNAEASEGFSLVINSGNINGTISVGSGAENAIVSIAPAAVLSDEAAAGLAALTGTTYVAGRKNAEGTSLYATVSAAINAAANNDTILLMCDVKEAIVIDDDDKIVFDPNDHTLSAENAHVITNNGKLTIVGNGTIDALTHQNAALYNNVGAEAQLLGATFERSNEDSNVNTYYTIVNQGTMTIDGSIVKNAGEHSSMIENGWYYPEQNTTKAFSILVIKSGTFDGGLYNVKNDDYGLLTIDGGTFNNSTTGAGNVLNWNKAVINNGTFTATGENSANVQQGYPGDSEYENAIIAITGGIFTAPEGNNNINYLYDSNYPVPTTQVSGGIYSHAIPADQCADDFEPKDNGDGTYGVQEDQTTTALTTTDADNAIVVEQGRVVCNSDFRIYDLTGRDVTRNNGTLHGVYVVKTDNNTVKVVVK
ncbi:MAG: hypothetical protein ACI392_01975 [Paludibacteraceae bacterium]